MEVGNAPNVRTITSKAGKNVTGARNPDQNKISMVNHNTYLKVITRINPLKSSNSKVNYRRIVNSKT